MDCEDDHGIAIRRAIDAGLYTITWQTLASIVVPPFFINRAMAGTRYLLTRYYRLKYYVVEMLFICILGLVVLILQLEDGYV